VTVKTGYVKLFLTGVRYKFEIDITMNTYVVKLPLAIKKMASNLFVIAMNFFLTTIVMNELWPNLGIFLQNHLASIF
jgi:hypothetical protein